MHKLKNKHTGEVITTPYMAEVEEYLNSGDYEMKPVYTKEMHERGELPPVGCFVEKATGKGRFDHDVFAETYDDCCIPYGWDAGAKLEVIAHTEISGSILPVVKHDEFVSAIILSNIKPIPTIEDEIGDFICNKAWGSRELASALIEKYNITPKES